MKIIKTKKNGANLITYKSMEDWFNADFKLMKQWHPMNQTWFDLKRESATSWWWRDANRSLDGTIYARFNTSTCNGVHNIEALYQYYLKELDCKHSKTKTYEGLYSKFTLCCECKTKVLT